MKSSLSEFQLQQIKELFNNGFGERIISKKLNISRGKILSAYKLLKLNTSDRIPLPRFKNNYLNGRVCKLCNNHKSINEFKHKKTYILTICIDCERIYNKTINSQNRAKIVRRSYRQNNKDKINQYYRNKRINDPCYRLRKICSGSINYYLKSNGSSKNNESCLKYLPYTIQELKEHLEKQFESWMTWDNQGTYNSVTWNEDQSTWTWQLDHIIPQSTFKYISMEDQSFKECWSLSNLRPLSAKQNIIDGSNRIRHEK